MNHEPVRNRAELDPLFQHLAAMSTQNLKKFGELVPVGMGVPREGQPAIAVAEAEDTVGMIQVLRQTLGEGLRDGSYLAVGMVHDRNRGDGKRGGVLCIDMAHQDGERLRMGIPYTQGFLGRITFEDPMRTEPEAAFFGG